MLLIPAIDLKGGRCVRLRQGRMEEETVFSDDPVAVAGRWVDAGTRRLHIVDLDGAVSGRPEHAEVIRSITERFPEVPVQVGGGIRDDDTVQSYLDAGVTYIIIGTKAVNAPHFVADVCAEFPGRIFIGLDARDGKVATDGWSKLSHHDVIDLAQQFERDGAECIVYTDIGRDGMMTGANVEVTVELARSIKIPVIAAGGIHTIDDVRALCEVADEGIVGAITGRAIYEGSLDFKEGQDLADRIAGGAS
ncbi:MAG: 1-(5-phosphoribosyl)-5-[(5-phosphoribosylamino)methylideneamino]imidazole-4-carboxamide isomerase [Gammaproteobacteria bacterium]|nr:1-(5-phosphoribosyl)-5-[(5-phosphoribosylamino)methylideneamino]imidazole-4-carboxamide isomerase [Gammaproteobacteria bacterium]NIM72461.1 1-(5-phosphoribosyl)-5-[(5-phosphoribosylamino)methylideneamino]imidazole-4-carboxamide isomerase [Gammaproteobacteria bacterium]NIO24220.1 1-(5-phosphoribosyl)-5-[(5-phosphoribosylamino)methylideneamino]imidazole-4-carboxamide isomerase [Gammaproteobacteria bacterium]NIO64825.1 1-(5-phosphoribosyl)-5-[(5-phosphoribosylamino)methylideneamino]imidazole-4-c